MEGLGIRRERTRWFDHSTPGEGGLAGGHDDGDGDDSAAGAGAALIKHSGCSLVPRMRERDTRYPGLCSQPNWWCHRSTHLNTMSANRMFSPLSASPLVSGLDRLDQPPELPFHSSATNGHDLATLTGVIIPPPCTCGCKLPARILSWQSQRGSGPRGSQKKPRPR